MSEKEDVKKEEVQPTPVPEKKEQPVEVSEDVKPPTVDKSVYDKVREAMRSERADKKEAQAEIVELRTRVEELENTETDLDLDEPVKDSRVDIMFLMAKDPFVKDNLDLIEQEMTTTKSDVKTAVKNVKADFFDRIQKETTAPSNKPLKNEKPTATGEEEVEQPLGDDPSKNFKEALKGNLDIDPMQLEAIKRHMPRQE
jgi:hypothetical protein